jgi:uncharacterized OB-fold protein
MTAPTTLQADYLGMQVELNSRETYNVDYFGHCARGEFHLQSCSACGLHRYPPAPSCPWCAHPDSVWKPVPGVGTVYSYMEVHHAVQPAFRPYTPFQILLVELDFQRALPGPDDGLRIIGNLTTPDGSLAPPDIIEQGGIGARVRMVFSSVAPGLSLPQWTLDQQQLDERPGWRYPMSTGET